MMKIKNRFTKDLVIQVDDDGALTYLDINGKPKQYPAPVDVETDDDGERDRRREHDAEENLDAPGSTD